MLGHEKLLLVFQKTLSIEPAASKDHIVFGKLKGWDSVAHMRLVSQIEKEFDLMLDTDDILAMSSFDEAAKILAKHGVPLDS